jgi:hypothetical protein
MAQDRNHRNIIEENQEQTNTRQKKEKIKQREIRNNIRTTLRHFSSLMLKHVFLVYGKCYFGTANFTV